VRNLIPSPLRSVPAFVGYLLILIAPLWALIAVLGSVDLVVSYADSIVRVLDSWWGILVLIVTGFALLAWDNYKRHAASDGKESSALRADAEDVGQLRAQLGEAKEEIDRLRIELNNRPPRRFEIPVETSGLRTPGEADEIEAEKQKLNAEIKELKTQLAEAQQTIRSQRNAMEDEKGVVHWGEHEGRTFEILTPSKTKELEELRAQVERLGNEATSPEVAKQKRLCFHLAGQLRRLYEEFLDGERLLDAQLQERREANVPEEELQEERRAKQLKLEGRVRQEYSYGFDDRLDKLYMELGPDGWLGPNDEDLFSSVGDPHDIKKVADRLDEVGRNLL
jgi:hypothetical protein